MILGPVIIPHPGAPMRLLLILALVGCTPKDDTGPADTPGETGETGAPRDCGPADMEPEPTAEGHPSDGWRWTKQGALLEDAEALLYGEGDLAPSLVLVPDGLHLIFARQRELDRDLWVSTSVDGEQWSEPVAVTGLTPGGSGYPGLLFEDGRYRLWHGSGHIDYSESADGVAYEPVGTALSVGGGDDFDSYSVLYPHPVRAEDALGLFYTGFDGQTYAIGGATSTDDGVSWQRDEGTIERDPDGFDNAAVAQPMALERQGRGQIWYGGYDTSQTNPGPWRVGFIDGDVTARTVAIPLAESGHDAWSTRDPAVVPWGDGWLMIYAGMGDDGIYRLMRATSDVCN
jgi:hypothetical protein